MDTDHTTLVIGVQLTQFRLEGSAGVSLVAAELGKAASRPTWLPAIGLCPGVCQEAFSSNNSVSVCMSAVLKASYPRLTVSAFSCILSSLS